MGFGRKIIIFCAFVSFVTGRAIDSEYDDSNTDLSGVKITRFHVATKIQMRYAITNVEVKVKNFDSSKTQEATFDMLLPEEAFVSNYTMIIKNETYVAKVEEKQEAKEIYQNSEGNTGLVRENYK